MMRIVWEMKSTLLLIASRTLVKEEINLKQQKKKKQEELKIGRKKSPRNRNQHVQEKLFLIHFLLYYVIITTCKDGASCCYCAYVLRIYFGITSREKPEFLSGGCFLIQRYCCALYDYAGQADLIKGCWNLNRRNKLKTTEEELKIREPGN